MGVVEFARKRRRGASGATDELEFADEGAAPGGVDARAEVIFQAGELRLPGGAVGGKFEAMVDAAERARVRGELRADNREPRAFEPCESGVGMVDAANNVAEKISSAVHERGILARGCGDANPRE